MGCTASRVANEDTVRRCRDRRRHMKDAVLSRHHLAAAHSDYLRSLRLTASALSRFSSFHSLSVSHHIPPVHLQNPTYPPSPPPISTSKPTHLSSGGSSPLYDHTTSKGVKKMESFSSKIGAFPAPTSNYAATPSQASSAWDWERFYPPSPPTSEFFDRLEQQRKQSNDQDGHTNVHHLPSEEDESSGDELENAKEAQCVGDHSSRTSTSTTKDEDVESRSGYFGSSRNCLGGTARSVLGSSSATNLAPSMGGGQAEAGMQMVVRHRNLKEIVATIEEYFVKAAAAGEAMMELLENGRAQLDRSFRQLRKTVYHSSGILSALSSTWTSKPPLAVKYRLDTAALEDSGGRESHCSTLERLLAWEKKLYQEVKAREGVKIQHEKKLASLQSLEHKGGNETKLDKIKAEIQKLQSLILVTSQAVSTTSSAILKVRDDELAPQLVKICHGFLSMWRSMNQYHEVQNRIVQQVRSLMNDSAALQSTSDLHRQATRDLESAVTEWHSSFTRLVKFNREYIRSLYAWLKLTRIEVCNDGVGKDHYSSVVSSELSAFCDDWKQALDRVPDTVAAEAINSFVNVIHSISLKQSEEIKIKKRVDNYTKELEKKSAALRSIERKFYQSYSTVGLTLPDKGSDEQLFDARDPLQEKKSEIVAIRRKVEDEMSKHTKAIVVTRDMTLNNIQTGLPGVFQAITAFSGVFVEALEGVCHQKGPHM